MFSRLYKRLLLRRLRKHVAVEASASKALVELDRAHLRAIVKTTARLRRIADTNTAQAILPLLSRNVALPLKLLDCPRKDMGAFASELLNMSRRASESAVQDGTIPKIVAAMCSQISSLLASKLPARCSLRGSACNDEISQALRQGWNPQIVCSIVIYKILENPLRYIDVAAPERTYSSAAPYCASRSEVRCCR